MESRHKKLGVRDKINAHSIRKGDPMQGRKKSAKDEPDLEYTTYRSWEKRLRAAASSDSYALFRDHMRRLSLPEKPKLMLEGTIRVIQAILAFASLDGRPLGRFLDMQEYNSSEAPDARYALTFDLCGEAFARVLVNSLQESLLDLADLYGYPWDDYKVAGYWCFWISHPDWSRLTSVELKQLESEVTDDLRFDYSEDELDFWFDDSLDASYLFVRLQDVEEGEEEE
jgi:hypothetical protein